MVNFEHWRRSGIFIVNYIVNNAPCSSVFIVNFEQVDPAWVSFYIYFYWDLLSFKFI